MPAPGWFRAATSGRMRELPSAYLCLNPRCRVVKFGRGSLCPSCRLAGSWGAGLAAVVAFVVTLVLKLWGVL